MNKSKIIRVTDKELIEHITMQDLEDARSKDLFKVAEQTSLETAKELILNCGGWNIYIPNTTSIKGALRNYVRKHFTGNNHKELALRLGVAESSIYKMLGEKEK